MKCEPEAGKRQKRKKNSTITVKTYHRRVSDLCPDSISVSSRALQSFTEIDKGMNVSRPSNKVFFRLVAGMVRSLSYR
jgi:hypothetical protein